MNPMFCLTKSADHHRFEWLQISVENVATRFKIIPYRWLNRASFLPKSEERAFLIGLTHQSINDVGTETESFCIGILIFWLVPDRECKRIHPPLNPSSPESKRNRNKNLKITRKMCACSVNASPHSSTTPSVVDLVEYICLWWLFEDRSIPSRAPLLRLFSFGALWMFLLMRLISFS